MSLLDQDHSLAARLATEAGELLVQLRRELFAKNSPQYVVKAAGDQIANRFLIDALRSERPEDAILSEEEGENRENYLSRLQAERVWIIDPLDGTREFSEPGRTDWAVHVAMCVAGEPLVGAVSLPELGVTYSTPETAAPPPSNGPPRLVVSRSRPAYEAMAIRAALDGVLHPLGSAGAKAMAVVRGEADIYAHSGGQYEWDSCAPVAVAKAAGLWASRIDGSPFRYNQPDPYLPDLLICRPELAQPALQAIARIHG